MQIAQGKAKAEILLHASWRIAYTQCLSQAVRFMVALFMLTHTYTHSHTNVIKITTALTHVRQSAETEVVCRWLRAAGRCAKVQLARWLAIQMHKLQNSRVAQAAKPLQTQLNLSTVATASWPLTTGQVLDATVDWTLTLVLCVCVCW